MGKSSFAISSLTVPALLFITICLASCKKSDNPIKYKMGTFPDSVIILSDINSTYDDYNLNIQQFEGYMPVIFSSNRKSSGGQFDLEQAIIWYTFSQTDGSFNIEATMTNDTFFGKLIDKATTGKNDFGPYRLFSSIDGFEYTIVSSENNNGNLDLYYLKNQPFYSSSSSVVDGPYPVRLLNTGYDDAYICFDADLDTVYFISNQGGDFDILLHPKPTGKDISSWFNLDYEASVKADSINSTSDDKCPYIHENIMVFTSNRPGGLGGYDLYYSLFKNGKWNSPVNFGPGINTSADEYRPVLGYDAAFTNLFLMFSSNRSGGKGGFDLYFTGVELSK